MVLTGRGSLECPDTLEGVPVPAPVSTPVQGAKPAQHRGSPRRLLSALRGAPVTLGYVALFWTLGIASSSIVSGPGPGWRDDVAATAQSLPAHWWAVFASALWARDLAGYVLGTGLVLLAGVPVERQIGSLKLAASAVTAQIVGILAATGFWEATRALMGTWALEMNGTYFLGPSAMVYGAVLAATASMGPLWRRRVRLGVFGLLILLALYSGGFTDLVRLGAGSAGALLGPLFLGRPPRLLRPVSSRHEGRVLIALLVAVSAVGPVVAGLTPHAVGPLSVLRLLFTDIQPVDPQTLQSVCAIQAQHRECEAMHLQLRAGGGAIFMAIVPSFLLLLLAEGLRRGRRAAWLGAMVVQAGLSVLALVTMVGVLQAAGPNTVAGELVDASQAGGRTHPLTLLVPLLLPVVLFVVLLACQPMFPVAAPRGDVQAAGHPRPGPGRRPRPALCRGRPGPGHRVQPRTEARRPRGRRSGQIPSPGVHCGLAARVLSRDHPGRAALRKRRDCLLGCYRRIGPQDVPASGPPPARRGQGPGPGDPDGRGRQFHFVDDDVARQRLLVFERR